MAKGQVTPSAFKPGQSGNPNGRPPKGTSLTELMREYLTEIDPVTGKERRQGFIEKVSQLAHKGDATALKLVWNYLEGMPTQKTDITTNGKDLPTPILAGVVDVHSNNGDSEGK